MFHGFLPFPEQAADFAGQDQESFRVLFNRGLLAKLHPFFILVMVAHNPGHSLSF
jgi:hypothetical protein